MPNEPDEDESPIEPEVSWNATDFDQIKNAMEFMKHVQQDLNSPGHETSKTLFAETFAEADSLANQSKARGSGQVYGTFGRFKIERLLGEGGSAFVYLAKDPKLDRRVALKVLKRSQLFSLDTRARFDREARATATLNHPNIVPIFETGIFNNNHFFVTAYCESISLRQWFERREKPLASQFAARIVAKLADATEHAHQRGIIHRDLKPANILITKDCGDSDVTESQFDSTQLHITDFGLARYVDISDSLETIEGAIVGTPAYMSPEQARGEKGVNVSTDIYSLGVILYELLTKKFPILGESHIETLLAINTKEPTPLRKLNRGIAKDLEAICLKCLNKSPVDRYSSAHDLNADLTRWLNGLPVEARSIPRSARLAKWCVRNPILTVAFMAISVALCIAITQWWGASQQSERADRHLAMTQDIIDEMVTNVARNPSLPPAMRREITQRAVDLQTELLQEEPDDSPTRIQTLRAYDRLIVLLVELCDHDAALIATDQALEIAESGDSVSFGEIKMDLVRHRVNLLRELERIDVAEKELERAIENNPQTTAGQARNRFELGMLKLGQKKPEEAVIQFDEALGYYMQLKNERPYQLEIARCYFFSGLAELQLSNLENSKSRIMKAVNIYEVLHRSMQSNETILEDFGKCYMYLGKIAHVQVRELGLPVEPESPMLTDSRKSFNQAAELFQVVIDLNPLRLTDYGLLAMTFEFHIALEVAQQDEQLAKQVLQKFESLFDVVPDSMREHKTIGRILAESHLKVAMMLFEKHKFQLAVQQVLACQEFVGQLIKRYPDDAQLESIVAECQRLLDSNANKPTGDQ